MGLRQLIPSCWNIVSSEKHDLKLLSFGVVFISTISSSCFTFKDLFILILCVWMFRLKPEETVGSPETGAADVCEPPCWGWGSDLGPRKALSPSIQHLKQLFPTIPWYWWPDSSFKIIQQNFTNKVLSIQDLFFGEVFFYPSGIYVVIDTKRVLELCFWDRVWLCNAGCPIRPG